jgi:RNA polymerase sigma-70 factor (ECF subfamily)
MRFHDVTLIDAEAAATRDVSADVTLQMDEDAFRGFYDRTSRMLGAYLARMTGDRQAAEDLLQETYYRFLRSGATLDGEAHRRHYLFRIATNLARDRFRQFKTQPAASGVDAELLATPGDREDTRANRRLDVTRAMAKLQPRERSMLWLAYAQGASHEEISEVVGVGRASVKTLLFRARRRLAALLDRGFDPPPALRRALANLANPKRRPRTLHWKKSAA